MLARDRRRGRGVRSGFTLIELLVVVAIIAILISILLPGLAAARDTAKAAVCGKRLRDFGNGLGLYASENKDYIPGLNTSGVAVMAKRFKWTADPGVLNKSKLPVQTWDWMTPTLAMSMELPGSRAERFKFLLDKFRCAAQGYTAAIYTGTVAPDIMQLREQGPWPAVSFLMPSAFQYFGVKTALPDGINKLALASYEGASAALKVYARSGVASWEVRTDEYVPRIDRVGVAAKKIFVADGTRYLDENQVLDFDASPAPEWNGSFASSGGWYAGDQSYGVRQGSLNWSGVGVSAGSESGGQGMALSYRHNLQRGVGDGDAHNNRGTMSAVFFDGHVERLTDRQSREISYWYPSGSIVQETGSGMTHVETSPENPFIIP